jgi:hypothetical protein
MLVFALRIEVELVACLCCRPPSLVTGEVLVVVSKVKVVR